MERGSYFSSVIRNSLAFGEHFFISLLANEGKLFSFGRNQMILVVGATGLVGSEISQRLAGRGEKVRGLIRATSSSEKVEALRRCGVELCVGDLKDSNSLISACRGVDTVISTASSTFSRQAGDSIESVDDAGQLNLVQAAKANAVSRFVFVSFRHAAGISFPLADAKIRVEAALSDFNFTVIQASFFMEVWLTPELGFDYLHRAARIYGHGAKSVSWVSFKDVAEMCVLALRNPATERRTIEFGGPEMLSPLQVVARFEEIGGTPFKLEHVPEEALRAQYEAATDPMQKSFAALMLTYASGDAIDMTHSRTDLGITLTNIDQYARSALGNAVSA
jgi:uncharacterized protein YbjT (DUF2867 family)